MNLQTHDSDLASVSRNNQTSHLSETLVKATVIGAVAGGVGLLLNRLWTPITHTVPPIIIKSVEDGEEPIEIESGVPLVEAPGLQQQAGSRLIPWRYTMPRFRETKFVEVFWETANGSWDSQEYENSSGCEVRIWLQHFVQGQWSIETGGPHLFVPGTMQGFRLTCDRLSVDKKNRGNPHQQRKRSFNKNKKWRIGRVQVDGEAPIDAITYMVIEFQDHYH